MRACKVLICVIVLLSNLNASFLLSGGATLSEPAYFTWSYYFYKKKGTTVYYDSIGSFPGIKKLKLNSIDFTSSDNKLSDDTLKKNELVQFPTLITTIDIVHNIPEIKDDFLKLTNETIAKIYNAEIKYWDNPSIISLNKDIKLPHKRIVVVVRKGDSGTTYYFTKHLKKTTKNWNKIGTTKSLELSHAVYGIKNEGVSAKVKEIPYSIGYIPAPYRILNKHSSISIQDLQGKWKKSLEIDYPIKVINYTITSKKSIKNNKIFVEFFNWVFTSGDRYIKELGYIPLNSNIKKGYYNLFLK
ncbi:MAG: phosphate ABC transporter substrate-binding protein PstS [Arcobacter sp.]|uniref:phosphate ABC transporter substrate-binding protein PstS n=1 Tax=Arcobacter sp. TaxID=1872629 RepID=UPI003B00F535